MAGLDKGVGWIQCLGILGGHRRIDIIEAVTIVGHKSSCAL